MVGDRGLSPYRRREDDSTSVPHFRCRFPRHKKVSEQVDFHHPSKVVFNRRTRIEDRNESFNAGIVYEDVQGLETSDVIRHRIPIADVADDGLHRGLGLGFHLRRRIDNGLVLREHHEIGTALRKQVTDGEADARARTGDKYRFARHVNSHFSLPSCAFQCR